MKIKDCVYCTFTQTRSVSLSIIIIYHIIVFVKSCACIFETVWILMVISGYTDILSVLQYLSFERWRKDYLLLLLINITPQILPLTYQTQAIFLKINHFEFKNETNRTTTCKSTFLKSPLSVMLIALRKKHLWREPSKSYLISIEIFQLCFIVYRSI